MTKFRPCIDLHEGVVKQIVGGTLTDEGARENFVSERSAGWFAEKFASDDLRGGHVIKLGPGNEEAAREALAAWEGGLQIGGGINAENAATWLEAGASQVIVTSWLFSQEGKFLAENLEALVRELGKEKLVIDLSSRRMADGSWRVAMNRWQTLTDLSLDLATLGELSGSCAEFLIHAADVEGLCEGVDEELVALFRDWEGCPVTYAGGVRDLGDARIVNELSAGKVDLTVGSALDLFGGNGMTYQEMVEWNQEG